MLSVLSSYLVKLGTVDIILVLLISLGKVLTQLRHSGKFLTLCANYS